MTLMDMAYTMGMMAGAFYTVFAIFAFKALKIFRRWVHTQRAKRRRQRILVRLRGYSD